MTGSQDDYERQRELELSCFAELLGLLAHDLSNPLQSLTVLLELTLDDHELSCDSSTKLRQALAAIADLRRSIRNMADFAQIGHRGLTVQSFRAGVERCVNIVRRRLQKQKFNVEIDIGAVGDERSPGLSFEFTVLSVLLSAINSAARSRLYEFDLRIVSHLSAPATPAEDIDPSVPAWLRISLRGRSPEGTWSEVALEVPATAKGHELHGSRMRVHGDTPCLTIPLLLAPSGPAR